MPSKPGGAGALKSRGGTIELVREGFTRRGIVGHRHLGDCLQAGGQGAFMVSRVEPDGLDVLNDAKLPLEPHGHYKHRLDRGEDDHERDPAFQLRPAPRGVLIGFSQALVSLRVRQPSPLEDVVSGLLVKLVGVQSNHLDCRHGLHFGGRLAQGHEPAFGFRIGPGNQGCEDEMLPQIFHFRSRHAAGNPRPIIRQDRHLLFQVVGE